MKTRTMKTTTWVLRTVIGWLTLMVIPVSCGTCDASEETIEVTFGNDEHLRSPGYPEPYPSGQECAFLISTDDDRKIRVEFEEFHLETRDNGQCIYDYFEFYDGDSTSERHLGRYCGNRVPSVILSTGSHLLVMFVSDQTIQPGAAEAKIESVAGNYIEPYEISQCGGLLTEDQGDFSSPGYPYGYESNEYCVYTISVAESDTVQLLFTSFDLEAHVHCQYDFVEVLDGDDMVSSPTIGRYCGGEGSRPPRIVESTGNKMTVIFHSDVSIHYEGFYAKYAISDIGFPDLPPASSTPTSDIVPVCDLSRAIITERGGIIVSHESYPEGQYPNEAECVVVIIGNRLSERVYLSIEEMDLQPPSSSEEEEEEECEAGSGDYIEVVDGDLNIFNPTVLGRQCGTQTESFISSFVYLQLHFITDNTRNRRHTGFKAIYAVYYEDSHGCETGDFQCRNNRCIANYLVCDGYNHCADNTDEDEGCGLEPDPDNPDTNIGKEDGKKRVDTGLIIGICIAIGAILVAVGCLVIIKVFSKPASRPETRLTNLGAQIERSEAADRVAGHENPVYQGDDTRAPSAPPKYSEVVDFPAVQTGPTADTGLNPVPFAAAAVAVVSPLEEKDRSFPSRGNFVEAPLPPSAPAGGQLPPLRTTPMSNPSRDVLYSSEAARLDGASTLPPISRPPPTRLPPLSDPPSYPN
ncbi:dorsal-ventral patterning tolloid-like protein 1 [Ptychodera flava]|uniref:dorsal-ventral patterning tolloid-like protein 1 n=1 Tax=Ptychodera flava TaxID=63121 RepID=UPI00396A6116